MTDSVSSLETKSVSSLETKQVQGISASPFTFWLSAIGLTIQTFSAIVLMTTPFMFHNFYANYLGGMMGGMMGYYTAITCFLSGTGGLRGSFSLSNHSQSGSASWVHHT